MTRPEAIRDWLNAHSGWCIEECGHRLIAGPSLRLMRETGIADERRELFHTTCPTCPNTMHLGGCSLPCDGGGALA